MTALSSHVTFGPAGPQVRETEIESAMKALRVAALPVPYLQYLQSLNGAEPHSARGADHLAEFWRIWWPPDSPAGSVGHVAFAAGMLRIGGIAEKANDLVVVNQVFEDRIPKQSLAFGYGEGGALFLLDLRPARFGQVLYWERQYESADDWRKNQYHNVGWVADDFVDFLNRIEVEPTDFDAWEAGLEPDESRDWNGFYDQ